MEKRVFSSLKRSYKYIYAATVVLIFWYIMHIILKSFVIPNPFEVIKRFFEIFPDILLKNVLVSGYRLLVALTITVLLGYSIGIVIGWNEKWDNILSPIIYLFFPIPRVAFLPVFMILFGLGDISKIILIIAIAIFQIIITTRDAVKSIPHELIISARALRLSQNMILRHVIIPGTLPKLFTAIRIALGSSMAALFFAENYATKLGIGYYIMNSWIKVDYTAMYSGIIAISIFGIVLFKIIDMFENKLCLWNK